MNELDEILIGFRDTIDTIDTRTKLFERFTDKCLPVKVQDMITNHMNSCLYDQTRRKHKEFTAVKTNMLSKGLLDDDKDIKTIEQQIFDLNMLAKRNIETEERNMRKRAAFGDMDAVDLEDESNPEGI